MIALTFTDQKKITSHLFLRETFDHFSLLEAEIVTFNQFQVNGLIQKDFFEPGTPLASYSPWKELRPFCLSLIRGDRAPLRFRLIFSLPPESTENLIRQHCLPIDPTTVQGLYLNIRYEDSRLFCVTGVSFRTFTMEKSLERIWDETVEKFFLKKEIPFECDR